MKKSAKKGFTLIELMIVLAIIAILAMVLIPKAGNFKSEAKNAGVATNVNQVRASLENKVGDKFIGTASALATNLNSMYSSDPIKNPFFTGNDDVVATSTTTNPAVYVVETTEPSLTNYKGSVIVVITNNTTTGEKYYTVFGVDGEGNKVNSVVIK